MEHVIKAAVARGASDLHIKAGDVFRARIDGEFQPLTKRRLTPEQTKSIALRLIPNEADRARIDSIKDFDCSWGAPGIGRFRVNILRQRSSFMIVMRAIPFDVPTVDKLGLPPIVSKIAEAERGLVVVTGPAGNGKSSTIAAMISQINATSNKHVVTLENPIEFLHRDVQSSVTQREVGVDTEGLATGVRAALRQDADVIFVSELLDHDVVNAAMQAAEMGSLVITSMHTGDATSTVSRIVSMFPPEEQELTRLRLADCLHAVVFQRLLPRADDQGRVAVAEIVLGTPEVRAVVKNRTRSGESQGLVEAGSEEHGMQSLDQHLRELVAAEVITKETAQATAKDPSVFEPPRKRRRTTKKRIKKST